MEPWNRYHNCSKFINEHDSSKSDMFIGQLHEVFLYGLHIIVVDLHFWIPLFHIHTNLAIMAIKPSMYYHIVAVFFIICDLRC